MMKALLFLSFLIVSTLAAKPTQFGYISYSSTNIGDDIQAVAVKRLLPEGSIPIDREYIGEFHHEPAVPTLVNGWFMHTKEIDWYRPDIPPPDVSWPPSENILPFFLSIHFIPEFLPQVLTKEGIAYLKKHAPIGARDHATAKILKEHGIDTFFSGCLTLTLERPTKPRKDVIFAVDLPKNCLEYLRQHSNTRIIAFSHEVPYDIFLANDHATRLEYAEWILDRYAQAKCVITPRLHATLPCLALNTPVLLLDLKPEGRLDGLRDLAHRCSQTDFLSGNVPFDWDNPPANPQAYLPIRAALLRRVANWVNKQ
ncbi:MAG: polysaccharide pyruvyl transferase family protein [Chlamydiia bacterium]|nr:polysaccharide pyruvyl transferase family protein [Chlamydiia bacterium]